MPHDLEHEVVTLLRSQGFDPQKPPTPEYLVMALMGAAAIVTRPLWVPARYCPKQDVIEVRAGLSAYARQWNLAHELAERLLHRWGVAPEHVEQLADALAGMLLVPGPALRLGLRLCGRNLPALSAVLGVSQTIVGVRLGEVTGNPLALVMPNRILLRGDEWGWPPEQELRRIAEVEPLPPEVERLRITDARRRVALVAA